MTAQTAYLPGEPIWVDLATPDVAAGAFLYGALLGRTATDGQPELGGYAGFLRGDREDGGSCSILRDPHGAVSGLLTTSS